MLAGRDGLCNLLLAGIGQCEEPDDLHFGIVEDELFVGYDLCAGYEPAGEFTRFGRKVADVGDLPLSALQHLVEVESAHPAEADQADFDWVHFIKVVSDCLLLEPSVSLWRIALYKFNPNMERFRKLELKM